MKPIVLLTLFAALTALALALYMGLDFLRRSSRVPPVPLGTTVYRDIAYVTNGCPPFIIVHGDRDLLVPHHQSELLAAALAKAGVPVTLYTVKGGGHGGFDDPNAEAVVREFFARYLKPNGQGR